MLQSITLPARLAYHDSDVRYQAFLEADALDDDSLLHLVSNCLAAPKLRLMHSAGRTAGVIGTVIPLTAALWWFRPSLAIIAVLLFGLSALIVRVAREKQSNERNRFHYIALARLMARRRDPRLLDACARMASQHHDRETGHYITEAVVRLLPLAGTEHRAIIAAHENLFAAVLSRPFDNVALTAAILAAFAKAGSKRILAYVQALAEAPNTGEFLAQALLAREREERDLRVRNCMEQEIQRERRFLSTGTAHVPDVFSMEDEPLSETRFNVSLRTQEELEAQLRDLASAARDCITAMQERLAQEEVAGSLLHPSNTPPNGAEDLVRAVRKSACDQSDLLRPRD